MEKNGKISSVDKVRNEEVLERVRIDRELLNALRIRKKRWIGHVLRGNGMLKEIIQGRMEGKRTRGRPRFGMLSDLITSSYGEMKREAEDRKK